MTISRRACAAPAGAARPDDLGSADDELALHASGLVAVDRAVEGVGALLKRDGHARGPALVDRLALLVDPMALDGDGVREPGWVGHDEGDLAVLGRERLVVEGD